MRIAFLIFFAASLTTALADQWQVVNMDKVTLEGTLVSALALTARAIPT